MCIPSTLVLFACGAQPGEEPSNQVDTSQEEVVVPGSPPLAATTSADLPPLPEGVSNAPAGSYVQAPKNSFTTVPIDASWNAGILGDQFSTPPAAGGMLINTENLGASGLSVYWSAGSWSSGVQDWVAAVADKKPPTDVKATAFGYSAARARWLRRQNLGSGTTPITPTPNAFLELQQRGARMYCAAQTAFSHQPPSQPVLMGKKALASVKIFGKRIDFGAIEPTISMAAPQKVDSGSNDGAEGFVIPLAGGVRVTPLSLLKSLPELRAPVMLVTGDTDTVARGNVSGSQFREWETLTHMVGFGSGNQVLASKDSPEIPLAVIGPFTITTKVTAGLEIASCAQADRLQVCNGSEGSPMGPVKRLLGPVTSGGVTTARPSTFARPRDGRWTDGTAVDGSFNDDAWVRNLDNNTIRDNDTTKPDFLMTPGESTNAPMGVRMLMDDDKSMELHTGVHMSATVNGKFGVPIALGPVSLTLKASGSIGLEGALVHAFREEEEIRLRAVWDANHEFVTMVPDPVTALTVTPRLEGAFTLGTSGTLTIDIAALFFHVTKDISLWSAKNAIDVTTGGWPEKTRLRIGTAHEMGGALASDSQSHWPSTGTVTNFASFPQSISSCLAPASPAPTALSTPCKPVTATPPGGSSTAPVGGFCVYYLANWDTDPDLDAATRTCKSKMSAYARSTVTKRQTAPSPSDPSDTPIELAGQLVDAHVLGTSLTNTADVADRNALKAALDACETAYGTTTTGVAKTKAELHVAPCDPSATLSASVFDLGAVGKDPAPSVSTIDTPSVCN